MRRNISHRRQPIPKHRQEGQRRTRCKLATQQQHPTGNGFEAQVLPPGKVLRSTLHCCDWHTTRSTWNEKKDYNSKNFGFQPTRKAPCARSVNTQVTCALFVCTNKDVVCHTIHAVPPRKPDETNELHSFDAHVNEPRSVEAASNMLLPYRGRQHRIIGKKDSYTAELGRTRNLSSFDFLRSQIDHSFCLA